MTEWKRIKSERVGSFDVVYETTYETMHPSECFDDVAYDIADIVRKIEAAREEGDLKENGGYHAAREEQGKNEARIRQLRHMLENAEIGTPPTSQDGIVRSEEHTSELQSH